MTTYSAFAYETVRLMTLAEWGKAWANLALTTGLSLGPVLARHGDRADLHRADELDPSRGCAP